MSLIVRDLPLLHVTSSASAATNAIGKLDDANSITLFFTTSFSGNSTGATIQISQFDPFDVPGGGYTGTSFAGPVSPPGTTQSSQWYILSTATIGQITSSGTSLTITNISFRGLRIGGMTSSTAAADTVAFASKSISV